LKKAIATRELLSVRDRWPNTKLLITNIYEPQRLRPANLRVASQRHPGGQSWLHLPPNQ
jgi:hypothetical protein